MPSVEGFSVLEQLFVKLGLGHQGGEGEPKKAGFRLENLYLTFPDGMLTALVGPNGCGKTTILKLIAGLIRPDEGEIRFDGRNMNDRPAQERNVGMVFQNFALYPHYTSRQNILSYFLFRPKTPELNQQARKKFERTSELLGVELEQLLDRYPGGLSAGEKQRVAIGRAITRDPAAILLDEPFVHLDAKVRDRYRANLRILLRDFGVTSVHVTHDQHEARLMADRLVLMDIGTIEQVGSYQDLYRRPKNLFVAEFLNLDQDTPALNRVDGHLLSSELAGKLIGVRPEDLQVVEQGAPSAMGVTIRRVIPLPVTSEALLVGESESGQLMWKASIHEDHRPGDRVTVGVRQCHVFDPAAGNREQTIRF